LDSLQRPSHGKSEALLLNPSPVKKDRPLRPPTTAHPRLNKRPVARFKDKLGTRRRHAFLSESSQPTYLTGYWHTTTERPEATFMNHDDADPWFMYPALDRDLVVPGGR